MQFENLKSDWMNEDHVMFQDAATKYLETEWKPRAEGWRKDGIMERTIWNEAGEMGLLCASIPEEHGGAGADWLYNVVVIEELAYAGATGPGFVVHSEMCAPYILAWGSEELKREWLPKMARGEAIGAIAMTEPGAGSDVKNIRMRARRDGDAYVLDGQKVYISNGQNADIVVTACKTDPDAGARGVSLIATQAATPGFSRGRNLDKIGLKAQDTSELFYEGVRVPAINRLGDEGQGFIMLMTKLAQERLTQAVRSIAVSEQALRWTIKHTREREAFDGTIADFQNTQFVLAGLEAEITAQRVFVDWCIERFMQGELTAVQSAKAKLVASELHCKTVDQCLQFFGGYGYMNEYPIARAYIDARIVKIAGGAIEVMKQIIWRDMASRND